MQAMTVLKLIYTFKIRLSTSTEVIEARTLDYI